MISIFMGIMSAGTSSSKNTPKFVREDTRNSELKFLIMHCKNPFWAASGEWTPALGPFSSRKLTSGNSFLHSCVIEDWCRSDHDLKKCNKTKSKEAAPLFNKILQQKSSLLMCAYF